MWSYLQPDALSLFLGRRFLQQAAADVQPLLKYRQHNDPANWDRIIHLRRLGFKEFCKYPRKVNLQIAVEELISNDMIAEAVILALKCIEQIEGIKQLALKMQGGAADTFLSPQQSQLGFAIDTIVYILGEIFRRAQELEAPKFPVPEVDNLPLKYPQLQVKL
jgi:hypothetical protein